MVLFGYRKRDKSGDFSYVTSAGLPKKWPKLVIWPPKFFLPQNRFKRALRQKGAFFTKPWPIFGHFSQNFQQFFGPLGSKFPRILAKFGRKTAFFNIFFKKCFGILVAKHTLKVWDSYHKHPKSYLVRWFVVVKNRDHLTFGSPCLYLF